MSGTEASVHEKMMEVVVPDFSGLDYYYVLPLTTSRYMYLYLQRSRGDKILSHGGAATFAGFSQYSYRGNGICIEIQKIPDLWTNIHGDRFRNGYTYCIGSLVN